VFSEPTDPHSRLRAPVSVPRDRLLGRSLTPAPRVPVRLLAWGVTDADVEHAIHRAEIGPGRAEWAFAVERLREIPCRLDLSDPKALAAEAGYHWAYVAYPGAEVADG
jgi:hypothetical protein